LPIPVVVDTENRLREGRLSAHSFPPSTAPAREAAESRRPHLIQLTPQIELVAVVTTGPGVVVVGLGLGK